MESRDVTSRVEQSTRASRKAWNGTATLHTSCYRILSAAIVLSIPQRLTNCVIPTKATLAA